MPSAETGVLIHVLWINAGLSRDGDPVALRQRTGDRPADHDLLHSPTRSAGGE